MRNCWLLILVGFSIFSIAVWQWGWIQSLGPEALDIPDCTMPIEYPLTEKCRHPDGYVLPFYTQPLNDLIPVVYAFTAGYVVPAGMVFIGFLGLFGRGPAAKVPQNSTE